MQPVSLTIHVDEHGNVALTGPIHDKVLCYGLLELGKETVADHHRQLRERLVQPSGVFPFPPLKGGS